MEALTLGVAAMERKARSKPMHNILNRILANKELNVNIIIFGDKVLVDEPATSWPIVDVLISFFSTGFPLDKAIEYVDLRKPILVNDLRLQKVLWDRRAVLSILDSVGVPTPRRIELDRDGGPVKSLDLDSIIRKDLSKRLNLDLESGREVEKVCRLKEGDDDVLIIGDKEIRKPFVEKPVSGEDHNVYIYFPKSRGGGARKLFRKVGNKSSEYDPNLTAPRTNGSYIYEEFMDVDNAEDIKVYTIGPYFVHAEVRKSPVVDGLVKRNPDGKEIRYITKLTEEEVKMATNITKAFKQNICGFDLLRVGNKSYVIDVNGWSFVKGNDFYYDKCAEILGKFCRTSGPRRPLSRGSISSISSTSSEEEQPINGSWILKSNITVFRHGDRTPKQKLKRSFKVSEDWTKPLIDLLQGRREEIILRSQLDLVSQAVERSRELLWKSSRKNQEEKEEMSKDLEIIRDLIEKKKDQNGTKIQMKPGFKKEKKDKEKKKEQVEGKDANEDLESDLKIESVEEGDKEKEKKEEKKETNKEKDGKEPNGIQEGELEKVQLILKWGGEFSHAARHQAKDFGQNMRRDLMIMCPAALKNCTIYTSSERRVTASAEIFAASLLDDPESPTSTPLQLMIRKDLLDDSNAAKDLMDITKEKLKASLRPDSGETLIEAPEGWPKDLPLPPELGTTIAGLLRDLCEIMKENFKRLNVDRIQTRWCTHENPSLFRERWEKLFLDYEEQPHDPSRTSELFDMLSHDGLHNRPFLETIFASPSDPPETKLDRLHKLYRASLALFLYVCPREYGVTPEEKEAIGLLTSMPLLNSIVNDLKASQDTKGLCALYFTKESHIWTLLNLILASELPVVLEKIPPLDYFSSITFEVYERSGHNGNGHAGGSSSSSSSRTGSPTEDSSATEKNEDEPERSLLISISEGAHSSNILSINLDARHALTPLPRRPLTTHMDLYEAIKKLSAHSLKSKPGDTSRGQVEVIDGKADEETGILPVSTRRESMDTDRGSIMTAGG